MRDAGGGLSIAAVIWQARLGRPAGAPGERARAGWRLRRPYVLWEGGPSPACPRSAVRRAQGDGILTWLPEGALAGRARAETQSPWSLRHSPPHPPPMHHCSSTKGAM